MPIYFNNLLYDYYLVNCTIMMLGCIALIGIIFSFVVIGSSEMIELGVCIISAIGLFAWCLVIARINIAIYNNLYIEYLSGFIILLISLSSIQLMFMSSYIKYVYTSSLFRLLLIGILLLAAITRWYHMDIGGSRIMNLLSMSIITCCIFVVCTFITFKYRYYLYYKSTHIDTYSPISQ